MTRINELKSQLQHIILLKLIYRMSAYTILRCGIIFWGKTLGDVWVRNMDTDNGSVNYLWQNEKYFDSINRRRIYIIRHIKCARFRWLGHVVSLGENLTAKRPFVGQRHSEGRPRFL